MRRISPERLRTKLRAIQVNKKLTLADSEAYLLGKRAELANYTAIEDFALDENPPDPKAHRACEHHLVQLRRHLARELWSREVFIGISVLDSILFHAFAHDTSTKPLLRALEVIRDGKLHHPGLVLYPVHSTGILGAGFLHTLTATRVSFVAEQYGFAVSPQTNSFAETMRFLDEARTALGVKKRLPTDLLEHWRRSRPTFWLERNPLLVVKAQSFPGGYYENQAQLVALLRFSTSLISLLSTLQPEEKDTLTRLSSSSRLNNWQTLDLKHYVVLHSGPGGGPLGGYCVPMHVAGPALAELCDMSVELDPRYWRRRRAMADRLHAAVRAVQHGYFKFCLGQAKEDTSARVYRKLLSSLTFFRRSFQASDGRWNEAVALAVAIEVLLTDRYAAGVTARLVDRARQLLRHIPHAKAMVDAVEGIYKMRSEVVHGGRAVTDVDLALARRAYAFTFLRLVERLPKSGELPASPDPIAALCS